MRRLLCLLCILALGCLSGAAAEDADFTLRFTLYPENFTAAHQPLAEGLAALCRVSTVRGHISAQGNAFVLHADAEVNGCILPLDVQGVPSHWRITSPALGDTALLVNNLALLEFGLKAEDYLSIPLQRALLLVPYAHTSAWPALAEAISPLLPAEDGEYHLPTDACQNVLDALIFLVENDRTVRCYLEALGVQTGELPGLAADFAQGMTAVREGRSLRWMAGDKLLMAFARTETGLSLEAALTGITLSLIWENAGGDFRFSLDAQGTLLTSPVHVYAAGFTDPDCMELTVYNDRHAPLATLRAELADTNSVPFPAFTAQTLDGVNLLSVNSETLAALMDAVGPTLLPQCISLLAACPAPAVQALMDALDNSGIMPLLTDALLYGYTAY